jgi:phage virion morphogenesis protein
MADDLQLFDDWFGRILRGLDPPQRRKAALKLGRLLRQSNLKRIGSNVQPDGTPFEPKKARYDPRGRLREKAGGKMFEGLRKLKYWRVDADDQGVAVTAASPLVDRNAAVSQFGEVATVGRLRNRKLIRYRYPERRLLGFSKEDDALALQVAAEMLEPEG